MALDVVNTGAAQAPNRTVQPRCRDVAGDELTAVLHRHRQRQRLAARARTEIGHPHPRPRVDEARDKLAALVLDLDQPGAESRRRW